MNISKSHIFHKIKIILVILLSIYSLEASSRSGFVQVKGGNLYYQVFGKGSPVVVLHGGPGLDQTYFFPQMMELAKNHHLVFYDQRGSGKSLFSEISDKSINVDSFVEDIELLRKQLGFKKIVLVGHSWGGMLAMLYSIKYPNSVNALILMNSSPANYEGFKAFMTEFKKRMHPIQNRIESIAQSKKFINKDQATFNQFSKLIMTKYLYKESDINKLSLNFSAETAKNQAKIDNIFTKSLLETDYDLTKQLKQLEIPTLIIHGETDPIPLWTAKQISKTIPKAKLIIIKESGHFSYAEKPKEVFSAINQFLDKVLK